MGPRFRSYLAALAGFFSFAAVHSVNSAANRSRLHNAKMIESLRYVRHGRGVGRVHRLG